MSTEKISPEMKTPSESNDDVAPESTAPDQPSTSTAQHKEPYPSIVLDKGTSETMAQGDTMEKSQELSEPIETESEPSITLTGLPQPDSPGHVDGGDRDGTRIYAGPFSDSSTTIASVPTVNVNGGNYQTRRRRGQTPISPVTSTSFSTSKHRRRATRTSPFCPCFSPTHSSDDEDDVTVVASSRNITPTPQPARHPHLPTTTPHRPTSSSRLPSWNVAQLARDIRCRLALAADATSAVNGGAQGAQPARSLMHNGRDSQPTHGILMCAQPYPVHCVVEYTHYLIPELDKITAAPYYWGVMDRFEAEKLLENKPEGTFLLRDSAQSEYVFSVSFRRYNRTLHARIEQAEHRFSFDAFDPQVFSAKSVTTLIDHYKEPARCLFFEPQLTTPLPRNFIVPLQHLCRSTICGAMKSYDGIDTLPIPDIRWTNYLKEYHYKHKLRQVNSEITRV